MTLDPSDGRNHASEESVYVICPHPNPQEKQSPSKKALQKGDGCQFTNMTSVAPVTSANGRAPDSGGLDFRSEPEHRGEGNKMIHFMKTHLSFIVAGVVTVSVSIIIIAVAVTYAGKADDRDQREPGVPRREDPAYYTDDSDYLATVEFVSRLWSNDLNNTNSQEFRYLASTTEKLIDLVFHESDLKEQFNYTVVTGFRKTVFGTVLVEHQLYLSSTVNVEISAQTMIQRFHEGYSRVLQTKSDEDVSQLNSLTYNVTKKLPPPSPIPATQCGEARLYPKASMGRIVGGTATDWYGVYPWVVLILRQGRHLCGGSIWDAQHILTAAHCIVGLPHLDGSIKVDSTTLEIIAGKWTFAVADSWKYSQRVRVSAARVHNGYDNGTFENDIAMLKLDQPLELNQVVEPICRPDRKTALPHNGTVAGWGTLQEGTHNYPDKLMEATVNLYSSQDCYRLFDTWFDNGNISRFLHDGTFCGANSLQGGIDTCQGDSGGPLFARVPPTSTSYTIVGIVSNGFGCARVGNPGFYTFVPHYLDWIKDTILIL